MTPRERAEKLYREQYEICGVPLVAIERAIADAVSDEREACAKVADTYRKLWGSTVEGSQDPGPTIADAIRARTK